MTLSLVAKILSSIETQWNIFESFLYYPTKIIEFNNYLKNYRGVAPASFHLNDKMEELAENSATGVVHFFSNIFIMEGIAHLENQEVESVLNEVEKNINLALYYWFGLNDRNYQFRTWVHFFGLEGVSKVFLTKDSREYSVTFSENGISFGVRKELHFPQILPISKSFMGKNDPLHNEQLDLGKQVDQAGQHLQQERKKFARLRTIQREICLLIDEWEYQNSILAVEYGQSVQFLHRNPTQQAQDFHQTLLKKMDTKRNLFASFSLHVLCDFQEWINLICTKNNNSDIAAEIDALCALILSALQKLFLPASISRLVYGEDVILLFERFSRARIEYCPDDFSACLLLQATQSAQGRHFSPHLFHILKSKSFEWKLCFDPSPALKSFCWAYSKQHHAILCTTMGLCYFKKCFLSHLEDSQFSDLTSAFQIQDSFLSFLNKEAVYQNSLTLPREMILELNTAFLGYLDTHLKKSKENLYCMEIIKKYLSLDEIKDVNS